MVIIENEDKYEAIYEIKYMGPELDIKLYRSEKHGMFNLRCYNCGNKHSEFIKYCEKCGVQLNPRLENDKNYKELKNKYFDVLNAE